MKRLIVKTSDEKLKKEAKSLGLALLEELDGLQTLQIKSKQNERKAIEAAEGKKHVLLEFAEEKIIPLENLLAELKGKTEVLVKVRSSEEARVALDALEIGADGVVLETNNPAELEKTMNALIASKRLALEEAKVTSIKLLGLGARACIDTCGLIDAGEGMLVGCSSQGMLLVQAEVEQNEFVSPRPFRVNAGAVSLYSIRPNGKTAYLEELRAGDEVLLVNRKGETRVLNVARSKIELRPLVLVEAENSSGNARAVLQNAETIRLVTPSGSIPVTKLKKGDAVMVKAEKGGRHFGTLVKEEEVIEK